MLQLAEATDRRLAAAESLPARQPESRGRGSPRVSALPRQAGQKEGRYAHLLSGEPDIPAATTAAAVPSTGLAARVADLETELAALRDRLENIENRQGA